MPTKARIQEENTQLKNKINDLENSLKAKEEEKKLELASKEQEYTVEKDRLEEEISNLEDQNKEKQDQLNSRELKKLARAYRDQEGIYEKDAGKWFKYVVTSFVILVISISLSIFLPSESIAINTKVLVVNFVLVTFLVFSLKQYSYYAKLRTDYANRKTLAQSYHNILDSSEDADLKPLFLEKATDVLCAKNDIKHESYTLPEKILESITETAKVLSKKV